MDAERARAALATAVRDDDARARDEREEGDDESSQRNVRAIARAACGAEGEDATRRKRG